MELILIAAVSENHVIGKDNDIPWYIPEDMKLFKKLTSGHPVIMGRKTYESLPDKFKPLPGRLNMILSRDENSVQEGAYVYNSMEEILSSLKDENPSVDGIDYDQVFIIGGQQIYELTLSLADRLEITHVKKTILSGDSFFPKIDQSIWKVTEKQDFVDYSFVTYRRNYKNG